MNEWHLDTSSGVPLYLQLKQKIIQKIMQGDWSPGYQLPTVRQMAVDVSINVNTVARVYSEVEREGYIRTHQGKGTFVQQSSVWREDARDRQGAIAAFTKLVVEMAQVQGVSLDELIDCLKETRNSSSR